MIKNMIKVQFFTHSILQSFQTRKTIVLGENCNYFKRAYLGKVKIQVKPR